MSRVNTVSTVQYLLIINHSHKITSVTCAYKHDIILAIFCFYFIHHYLGELVVHICFDNDWFVVDGVHRVEHGWMTSGKGNNFVREVFGCIKSSKCLAWALSRNKKDDSCNFTTQKKYLHHCHPNNIINSS